MIFVRLLPILFTKNKISKLWNYERKNHKRNLNKEWRTRKDKQGNRKEKQEKEE